MRNTLATFKRYSRSHPRKTAVYALLVLVALACGIMVAWWSVPTSRLYEIRPAGITVALPAAPQPLESSSEDDVFVCETRVRETATVIAVSRVESSGPAAMRAVIDQAMAHLAAKADVEGLRYEVSSAVINGRNGSRVAGRFRRNGVRSRVMGVFAANEQGIVHVLCFYSDDVGARMAGRTLRSVRFLQNTPDDPR